MCFIKTWGIGNRASNREVRCLGAEWPASHLIWHGFHLLELGNELIYGTSENLDFPCVMSHLLLVHPYKGGWEHGLTDLWYYCHPQLLPLPVSSLRTSFTFFYSPGPIPILSLKYYSCSSSCLEYSLTYLIPSKYSGVFCLQLRIMPPGSILLVKILFSCLLLNTN